MYKTVMKFTLKSDVKSFKLYYLEIYFLAHTLFEKANHENNFKS